LGTAGSKKHYFNESNGQHQNLSCALVRQSSGNSEVESHLQRVVGAFRVCRRVLRRRTSFSRPSPGKSST
jgi:hypothetical protein